MPLLVSDSLDQLRPASSADYADLPGLLAALFSSLLDEEPWAAFVDHLAHTADATWATLILTPRTADQPGIILTPGADPDVGRDYARRLFAGDPFTGLPEGKVAHFRDFVPADALRRNAPYREFLLQTSSDEVLGVDVADPGGIELRLRLTRAPGAPPFAPEDARHFERLVPHLRIALRLFDRLATGETEQRIYAGAVAQMAVGVILLDRGGKVIHLNARASTILAERDGIALRGDAIRLDDPDLGRQLDARLLQTDEETPLTLRIERPSGDGDLLLVVGNAHAPGHITAGGGPAAVLFLNDPAHAPRVSPDAIRDLLGLTQSEAVVAADIASGLSLADIATRRGISPNTVRAHLRAIFGKTGVKRQSQLVHLVHHSLPGLTQPAPV
jgi:DNA-binding CsgD family transcriptional regulator